MNYIHLTDSVRLISINYGGLMSKIGRNAPCPCGSGRKYKLCCIGKDASEIYGGANDDILKISNYGTNSYERAELDKFSRFFIETTVGEKFEVRKIADGYMVKDIIPPVNSMLVKDYRTIDLNDIQKQKLLKHNPNYEQMNIGSVNCFDGIIEDGHFGWEQADGISSSRGKINKLFIKQTLGNYILNINLFPPKDEYKSIDKFLETGFLIYTQASKLDFTGRDGKLFFEGNQVFAVLSIYDKDSLSIDEMFSQTPTEYNVCYDILIGKPLFVLKIQDDGLKISVINEKVIEITSL